MPNPRYFRSFPTIDVKIDNVTRTITDLTTAVRITAPLKVKGFPFYDYIIKDGERPDHVAYKTYGDTKFYWTILVVNEIYDLWKDWPLTKSAFDAMLVENYGSISTAKSQIKKYYNDTDDIEVDYTTYLTLSANARSTKTIYEYEYELNEAKRPIKLIQPQYVSQVAAELRELFKETA